MKYLALILILLTGSALAQGGMGPGPGTVHSTVVVPYVGPLDVVPTAKFAGGLRAMSAATAGTKAIQVCNAGDAACVDFSTDAATGNLVVTTFGAGPTNCATSPTTCTIKTIYDKSGNVCDATQATIGNRLTLVLSGNGYYPTMRAAGGAVTMTSCGFSQAVPITYSAVAINTTSTGTLGTLIGGGSSASGIFFNESVGNQIVVYSTPTLSSPVSATDGQWHNVSAVINGGSSLINVDTTITALSVGTTGITNHINFANDESAGLPCKCDFEEWIVWPAGLTNPTQLNAIDANQHTYWGTGL